jgi:hypothetical protein
VWNLVSRVALFIPIAKQPLVSQSLLMIEASPSHSDTHTHSVGVLWKSDQPEAQNSTWQHTTLKTDSHTCSRVVRTHNSSRPEAAETRLRPRGQWDRSLNILGKCNSLYNIFWTASSLVLVLCRLFQLALTAMYLSEIKYKLICLSSF